MCEERMIRHLRAIALAAFVATALTTAGCNSSTPAPQSNSAKPDKVTFVTAFGAVGRDALAWVAKEKGYFAEQNLDVTIQLGAGTDPNLTALTAGQAQFASIDMTGVMIQAGKARSRTSARSRCCTSRRSSPS